MRRRVGWSTRPIHMNVFHGVKGSYHDGQGYACSECGTTWSPYRRNLWWPVRLGWSKWWSLGWHYWEAKAEGIEQIALGQVLSLGPLRVIFGKDDPDRDPTGARDCRVCAKEHP